MYRYRTYRTNPAGGVAAIVSTVGGVLALIEIVYILLQVFDANQSNRFFTFIKGLAEPLALFFPGLFNTGSRDWDIIINYGLAAVFWLVVTGIIARLLARI
ncbi:hypothetical protein J2W56_004070 [Nocardia kruczakiae]|uniref:YggT family protein n=1 Tax=Nocardia kruczakiae TaxID=261477 RepID=A0ABU1XII8_9NOCA|nr:hypothetical protein [Nocardia kruczakiae]MDR7170319.1 hypothetical protein [Nocardia kruczakiae]